jgi:hypothetical protein
VARAERSAAGGTAEGLMAVYTGGAYILYSELFDRKPEWADVVRILHGLNRLHTVLLMSRINTHLRHALDSPGPEALNRVQGFLTRNFIDDLTLERLQERFPNVQMRDQPIFHPLQVLNMLRLATAECSGGEQQRPDQSEAFRFQLGTACLMMNDLLVSEEEELAITKASADERERLLMAQMLTMWEVMNPTDARHLLFRSHVLFRCLFKDEAIRDEIRGKCRGFDIGERFRQVAKMELDKWLSLIFAVYSYYMGRRVEELNEQPQVFVINRQAFIGRSGITQVEMDDFLTTVSSPFDELCAAVSKERPVDPRFDFVPFRSRPLYATAEGNFACFDTAFLLEKMYSGVHWLIHDDLPLNERNDLFKAWGLLFERYVHWLFSGFPNGPAAAYFPFPRWEGGQESFDAVFLKESLLIPLEYKGGFLSQEAKYSARADALIDELERKVVPGCDQLAAKIASLFDVDRSKRKTLTGIPVQQVRRVMPVLIVQDHALRGLSINWWLNRRFRELMSARPIRAGVEVVPLNVVNIEDLERLVESSDSGTFDFIYSLHNKAVRDPEMKQQLHNFLFGSAGYCTSESTRWKRIQDQIEEAMFSYTFPKEWKDQGGLAR